MELNKPEYNLNNKDIKGSSPKLNKFTTNRTPNNPLEPKYKLPSYETLPFDQPKFIRDTLNTRDIEGAYPKKCATWQMRKNENNFNIKKSPIRKDNMSNYNYLDYADIHKQKFITGRNVNPLDPIYDVKFNNEPIGQIEKSKPKELYSIVYSDPKNLKTNDIGGAQIGTKNKINKFTNRETNNLVVTDIAGTAVGSFKNHISTNRHLNPICPEYIMPGHSREGELFNPYGDKPKSGNKNRKNKDKDEDGKIVNVYEKEEILNEINQVSKTFLNEKKAGKQTLGQEGYSYTRSIVNNNYFYSNKKNDSRDKNEKGSNKKFNEKQINKNNGTETNNNNYNKGYVNENKAEEKKIYKRIDSSRKIQFEGKENLKENEVIGFNNQIYSVPPYFYLLFSFYEI